MNDKPRQTLREIVEKYGEGIADDPRRCKALLFDYCSKYRREIFVLTTAQQEKVASDLRDKHRNMPMSVLVAQLTQRLMDNRALARDAAHWAVTAWAEALGLDVTGIPTPPPASSPPPMPDAPQTDTPPDTPSPARGQDAFTSNYLVEVYGRARRGEDREWKRLGTTPGIVVIPPDYELGLHPSGIEGDALARWVSSIAYPERVTSLDIDGQVNDTGMRALAAFSHLTYLDIDNGEAVTDMGLSYLRELSALATLNLAWLSRVTDNGIVHLRELGHLTNLSLIWTNLTDGSIRYLSALRRLTSLSLRECRKLTGSSLGHLAGLSNLRTLELTGGRQVGDEGLRALSAITSLTKLDVSRCPRITMWGIEHLPALAHLVYLDLSWDTGVGDVGLVPLKELPHLSTLHLARIGIGNSGVKYLSRIAGLIYLDLSWCETITDRGLLPLRELKHLAYLNLTGCKRLTARGIARLERAGLYITGR